MYLVTSAVRVQYVCIYVGCTGSASSSGGSFTPPNQRKGQQQQQQLPVKQTASPKVCSAQAFLAQGKKLCLFSNIVHVIVVVVHVRHNLVCTLVLVEVSRLDKRNVQHMLTTQNYVQIGTV